MVKKKKTRKRLGKGIRKHIRQEKARIRREVFDIGEQKRLISQVLEKVYSQPKPSAKISQNNSSKPKPKLDPKPKPKPKPKIDPKPKPKSQNQKPNS